jgi:hypothetical protein
MVKPWNVSEKQLSQLLLWRLPDKNFRIMRVGDLTPLITGYQYILVHQSIVAPFFTLSSDQVRIYPRTIINHVTGQVWNDYSELDIVHSTTPASIQNIVEEKIQIWKYDSTYMFVSPTIKNALEELTDQLEFSLGFSYFA